MMSQSRAYYTPLRYPGGKARFAPFILGVLKRNNLIGGDYFEPYAGGAGIALDLLFNGHVAHVHINDYDPAIYYFWKALKDETSQFLDLLSDTPVNVEQWHRWRAILREETPASLVERGFATLFINRTNRSGVLKGGIIGGKEQGGKYKIDVRFNKESLIARIEKIASHKSDISIYNEDALSLLKRCSKILPKKSLIYLDPPYYVRGSRLYRNFYKEADHLAIANTLQSAKFEFPWVVSYDNVKEIRSMYKNQKKFSYQLSYSLQDKKIGEEIVFVSPNLTCPKSILSSL
jgi:DNA adenine methylase